MSAKFHELLALILLSVAIFIHSSKLARIGTRFMGVTALPPTTTSSSSSSARPPPVRRRGVCGFEPGEAVAILLPPFRGVAASFIWWIWASWRACRECSRRAFSRASSLRGILLSKVYSVSVAALRGPVAGEG